MENSVAVIEGPSNGRNSFLGRMSSRQARGYTHEFIAEFIQLYRSYPCLWQVRCKTYKDRLCRNRAYDALARKLREINPVADRETVVKKINTLRSAFTREYKKVRISQRTVANPHRRYKSSLWYYDLLKFVMEQNAKPTVTSVVTLSEDNPEDASMILDRCQEETGNAIKIEQQSMAAFQPVILETKGSYGTRLSSFQSNESTKTGSDDFHDVHEKAAEIPRGQSTGRAVDDDDFETFGCYVAIKLRKSAPRQSIIAERIIADVLLRANLGALEENTCLMDVTHSHSIFGNERSTDPRY